MERGFTVWFTGLSCSGKTTVSQGVAEELLRRGLKVEVLDGDVVRTNLSKGLGFNKEDRDTNIKRVVAVGAAISPYREIRDFNRREIGDFVEVYCRCPLEVCIERDVKGLYKKALAGEIPNYTGVSDPYEEPLKPEVVLETDKETVEESVGKVIRKLEELRYLSPAQAAEYSEEEEEKIKQRLADLGYL